MAIAMPIEVFMTIMQNYIKKLFISFQDLLYMIIIKLFLYMNS
jgi:hypothetical protein